jgi:hypothetical protein
MVPVTHPTELLAGKAATFQFLLDGKPAADLTVSAVNGGVRYRDGIQQLSLKTDAQGKVTITWPEAGMWWVSVSSGGSRGGGNPAVPGEAAAPQAGASSTEGPRRVIAPPQPRASYAMTVEVLPS